MLRALPHTISHHSEYFLEYESCTWTKIVGGLNMPPQDCECDNVSTKVCNHRQKPKSAHMLKQTSHIPQKVGEVPHLGFR